MNRIEKIAWRREIVIGLLLMTACGSDKKDEKADPENTYARCTDRVDNDKDGAIDCDDGECAEVCAAITEWEITSPGETLKANLMLLDFEGEADYPAGARLYYRVAVGGPDDYIEAIPASPMGLERSDDDFVDGLKYNAETDVTAIDENYTMISGKRRTVEVSANEKTVTFRSGAGNMLQVVMRAHDDGFAFRYVFPEKNGDERTVVHESTGFRIPDGSRAWMLPYDAAGEYTPAYENYWQNDISSGTPSSTMVGWCLPALFETPEGHWVLLAETDVTRSYAGVHLEKAAPEGVYRVALPPLSEANETGESEPSWNLPWTMPWRILVVGDSLANIVETTLPTDLATPGAVEETDWIEPGRVSWSWWSDDNSPSNYTTLTTFVDLAEEMGWEYSLVDTQWHIMGGGGDWMELADYADGAGVGLFVWYNSGGDHNSVNLGPRNRMDDAAKRRQEFETISEAGIRGVKVDFFHSDKQWMMQYYLDILEDAAAHELLVNFHGATIPRGWQRTYPNLMTAEAVRGAEMYKYDGSYPSGQPMRNTILPFTRNVMGSMDFTPVTFTDHAHPHLTSFGHELALSVVFESALQHFADDVSGYQSLPEAPKAFLMQVPTVWDDIRFIDGEPGRFVVLARKNGDDWYLGGVSGEEDRQSLDIDLSFLESGNFDMVLITDGATDTEFEDATGRVSAEDTIAVEMLPYGGFVARFEPR